MRVDIFLYVFVFLIHNLISGYHIGIWEDPSIKGDGWSKYSITAQECVNMDPAWLNRISSVNTQGFCFKVYTQLDCQGPATYLHRGYSHVYRYLSAFNIDNKIASLRVCESNVQFNLNARPQYTMSVHDGAEGSGNSYVIEAVSGECHTLPKEWHARVSSINIPYWNCWTLYDGTECTGSKRDMNQNTPHRGSLKDINFGNVAKSVKTCELEFHGQCKPGTCPKYLQEHSKEYTFWKTFFTIYSKRYLGPFEERVKTSRDGLISWDFMFAPNKSALSRGDQYVDSFGILHLALFSLVEGQAGKLGFHKVNIDILSGLAESIYKERNMHAEHYTADWTDHNYVVMDQMKPLWFETHRILTKIEDIWNAAEEKLYGEEYMATFYESELKQYAETKVRYVGGKCVNMVPNWQERVSSVDTRGYCLKVYTKLDCQGPATYLHRGYPDYNYLSAFNLDEKIASFTKCEPNVQFKLDVHPRYTMAVNNFHDPYGIRYTIEATSGECYTLPQKLTNIVLSIVIPYWNCWTLYDGVACTGNRRDVNQETPFDDAATRSINFGTKSMKTCELEFQGECKPSKCPKYVHQRSVEQVFWRRFYSFYSRSFRIQFDERVKNSRDGFISWDFLFGLNSSAVSRGDQYADAFANLHLVLFSLIEGHPGTLGFSVENIDTLSDLAKAVCQERNVDIEKYTEDWNDQNYVVMRHMAFLWNKTDEIIDKVISYWNPEQANDICGLVQPRKSLFNSTPLVSDGVEATYGEEPWHAALYRRSGGIRTLICGATIISPSVLVSAAHCFFSEPLEIALNNTSEYEIYIAKFSRTYSTVDGPYQKIHKVKQLIFHPDGYNPITSRSYRTDIILIVLEEPIKYNSFVRPACIDWDGSIFRDSSDDEDNWGRVVGWGLTTTGEVPDPRDASERLLVANLPYVSYSKCLLLVEHITADKFCGGTKLGPSVQQGDSGGGFMFKIGKRHYLRGVVSTKDEEPHNSISTFTNVATYISWMKKYI